MKYLLDTHTLIWSIFEPEELSGKVSGILSNRRNQIFVSTVSLWEIAIMVRIGKLEQSKFSIPGLLEFCKQLNFTILPVVPQNTVSYLALPLFKNHRAPFDRMLVAIAIERGVTLLSRDTKLPQYDGVGLLHIW